MNQQADELMIHAGKLSMLIEAEGETPVGRLIDLSSRLNMLSQRLARLYLLAQGDSRSQGVVVDIEQARKELSTGLNELDTARENSPASRDAIGLAFFVPHRPHKDTRMIAIAPHEILKLAQPFRIR